MKKLAIILLFLTVAMVIPMSPVVATETKADTKPAAIKLSIATRHDSVIYNRFAAEFVKSTYAQEVGITSVDEIKFNAPSTYDAFYKTMTNPFFETDIGWGGGPTLFNTLMKDGALSPIDDPTLLSILDTSVNDSIAGAEMKKYDDSGNLYWVANAISSFGFTVNKQTLAERNLPTPTTWEDLASPEFFTSSSVANIGIGNAPDTTSNTRIYQIIFQKYGWQRGWEIINGMAGNGRVYRGSVETRQSVISGETAVAMTIDFYGIIAQKENPNTEYIVPANASIVNGDPIALAVNPAHKAEAIAFLKFVFSKEGQALYLAQDINRLPVRGDAFDTPLGQTRPDIKSLYEQTLSNQGIIFNETLAASLEEAMRYHWEATITNVNDKLKTTWGRIMNDWKGGAFSENRLNELIHEFGRPAMSMEEAMNINDQIISDSDFRAQKQSEWASNATAKFDAVDKLRTEPETIVTSVTSVTTTEVTNVTTTEITTVINGTTTVITSTITNVLTSSVTSIIVSSTTSAVKSVANTVTTIPWPAAFVFFAAFTAASAIRKRRRRSTD